MSPSTTDALAWLDDLPEELGEEPAIGSRLPIFVVATLMRARAVAEDLEPGPARVRMRSRSGRWLVCHASCLRDSDGRLGHTALVIEPASSSEIAPSSSAHTNSRRASSRAPN